jgi:hypothetical protein
VRATQPHAPSKNLRISLDFTLAQMWMLAATQRKRSSTNQSEAQAATGQAFVVVPDWDTASRELP